LNTIIAIDKAIHVNDIKYRIIFNHHGKNVFLVDFFKYTPFTVLLNLFAFEEILSFMILFSLFVFDLRPLVCLNVWTKTNTGRNAAKFVSKPQRIFKKFKF
jgi:hypothetical protein